MYVTLQYKPALGSETLPQNMRFKLQCATCLMKQTFTGSDLDSTEYSADDGCREYSIDCLCCGRKIFVVYSLPTRLQAALFANYETID